MCDVWRPTRPDAPSQTSWPSSRCTTGIWERTTGTSRSAASRYSASRTPTRSTARRRAGPVRPRPTYCSRCWRTTPSTSGCAGSTFGFFPSIGAVNPSLTASARRSTTVTATVTAAAHEQRTRGRKSPPAGASRGFAQGISLRWRSRGRESCHRRRRACCRRRSRAGLRTRRRRRWRCLPGHPRGGTESAAAGWPRPRGLTRRRD